MVKNPKVFISYSWDDETHMDWVAYLANTLRDNGIEANIDRFKTQQGTVNLNKMMIENLMENEFILVVMTPKYAERANSYRGGVGLETMLLANELLSNTSKIIPIKRSKLSDDNVIPYYLKGLHYIDFTEDCNFERCLVELKHRILGVDMIEVSPIGNIPELKARKIEYKNTSSNKVMTGFNSAIPDLRTITDLDKINFLKDSFDTIKNSLFELLEGTKHKNTNFQYMIDDRNNKDFTIRTFIGGKEKGVVRIWRDNFMSQGVENIFISYDSYSFGNSFNNMICCENKNNELYLKMTMCMGNEPKNFEDIILYIWNEICNKFKY